MTKPIVAIDVDDVLTSSNEGVRLFINRTFGTLHDPDDYLVPGDYSHYWDRVWGVDEKTAAEWYKTYVDSDETFHLLPVPGAIPAVKQLEAKYDLVIVSARDVPQIEHTKRWLQKHLPKVFKQVEFLKLHPKGTDATKAMLLQEIGAQYLIDDNLDHCIPAQEAGIQTLLFGEYGWSSGRELPDGIVRVKDWAAVLRYFDGLASR